MEFQGGLKEKWDALPEWVRQLVGKYRGEWEELPKSVQDYFTSEEGQARLDRAFQEYTKDVHGEFR